MDKIKEIEVSRQEALDKVALGDALDRLTRNRDFKKLIEKGYFVEEASRLALISADPRLSADERVAIAESIKGISHFNQFLMQIAWASNQAAQALEDLREYQEEVEAEEEDV